MKAGLDSQPRLCYSRAANHSEVPMAEWHVLRVEAGREKDAEKVLCDQETFPVYLPIQNIRFFNRRNRVWRIGTAVMFPGYLFLDATDVTKVRLCISRLIYGFLKYRSGVLATINEQEMRMIRLTEAEGPLGPAHPFRLDSLVEIKDDLWAGQKFMVTMLRGLNDLEVVPQEGGHKMVVPSNRLRALAA